MIKKYIDRYIKSRVYDCFISNMDGLRKTIDDRVSEMGKMEERIFKFSETLKNHFNNIRSEIEQKDQRITDLIEQTKNQIIERMVSTEIKPKGKIKEISKEERILFIFKANPQQILSPKQIHEALGCNKKHEKGYVSLLLQNLIKKGLIKKVKHGLYQYDKGW